MPTVFRAYEGWSPRLGDPLDRLPLAPPRAFSASPVAPEGVAEVARRPEGQYARVPWAGREVLVALYAPTGSSLSLPLLCVDADGDGAFEGAGERRRVRGRQDDRGQTWRGEFTVDGVPGMLTMERTTTERRALRLGADGAQVLLLRPLPPEALSGPEQSAVVLLAALPCSVPGSATDALLGFARDAGERAWVGVDADGDGRVSTGDRWVEATSDEPRGEARTWVARGVEAGGAGSVDVRFVERLSRTRGTLGPPGALRGTVTLSGRRHALFLLDRDLDGTYTSPEDLWWFGPVERLQRLGELTPDTCVEGGEPAYLGACAWRLRIVEADGTAHLAQDPGAGTLSSYLERRAARAGRRWAERLAPEMEAFRKANGIDPGRPRAEHAPAWIHGGDLSEGLARAKAEQRPVLVCFTADWCPWCHRLDLYTFADAEVVGLLERFVCVRLAYDFLLGSEYERFDGRGLPFLLLLTPEGRLIERPGHDPCDPCQGAVLRAFEAPHVFAGRLRAALTAFEGLPGAPGGR